MRTMDMGAAIHAANARAEAAERQYRDIKLCFDAFGDVVRSYAPQEQWTYDGAAEWLKGLLARADAAEKLAAFYRNERDFFEDALRRQLEASKSAEAEAARLRKDTKLAYDSLNEWDDEYNEDSATPRPIQFAIDRLAAALQDTPESEAE